MSAHPANAAKATLASREYTLADQKAFAALSGDSNPLHVDPLQARRTILGGVAVHGLNLAMCAMEALLAHLSGKEVSAPAVAGVSAQFSKPVFPGEKVRFQLAPQPAGAYRTFGMVEDVTVFRVNVQTGPASAHPAEIAMPAEHSEPLVDADFDALKEARGELALALDTALAAQLFPRLLSNLGSTGMAGLLALTRLVGMRCPGLHSLFGQLDVRFEAAASGGSLRYRVIEADERYRRMVMEVEGARLKGTVQAFVRPPPASQPAMEEVARAVPAGSFSGSRALIIGGSRGIGELTAKMIAAGGGLPIVTYYQGAADAERVAKEIRDGGGICEILQLDARRAGAALRKLFRGKNPPLSLYYFATPRIGGRRRKFFSGEMLDEFVEYYVTAFGRMMEAARVAGLKKLRVFYPSSIFAGQVAPDTAEYSMAKRMGEELCAFYNTHCPQIEIIIDRLPHLATDQNLSILAAPSRDGMEVMLPLVRRMEQAGTEAGGT